jgi:hypothetical protein
MLHDAVLAVRAHGVAAADEVCSRLDTVCEDEESAVRNALSGAVPTGRVACAHVLEVATAAHFVDRLRTAEAAEGEVEGWAAAREQAEGIVARWLDARVQDAAEDSMGDLAEVCTSVDIHDGACFALRRNEANALLLLAWTD